MTVILVLCTFLVFIGIDLWLNRRKAVTVAAEPVAANAPVREDYIEGFLVPSTVRYHAGHSWLHRERKNVIRVGMDEFAAALAGRVEKFELPKPGHWVRQGQKAWSFLRAGEKGEMVSPIEGEIVEINHEVVENPSLVREDPYGKGWLFTVFAPDEESTLRNMLPQNLVSEWMRSSVEKLYGLQPGLAGAVAADGGRPAEDLCGALPNVNWKEVTREFFLT